MIKRIHFVLFVLLVQERRIKEKEARRAAREARRATRIEEENSESNDEKQEENSERFVDRRSIFLCEFVSCRLIFKKTKFVASRKRNKEKEKSQRSTFIDGIDRSRRDEIDRRYRKISSVLVIEIKKRN